MVLCWDVMDRLKFDEVFFVVYCGERVVVVMLCCFMELALLEEE